MTIKELYDWAEKNSPDFVIIELEKMMSGLLEKTAYRFNKE